MVHKHLCQEFQHLMPKKHLQPPCDLMSVFGPDQDTSLDLFSFRADDLPLYTLKQVKLLLLLNQYIPS